MNPLCTASKLSKIEKLPLYGFAGLFKKLSLCGLKIALVILNLPFDNPPASLLSLPKRSPKVAQKDLQPPIFNPIGQNPGTLHKAPLIKL